MNGHGLFTDCVIPGCDHPVAQVGDVCETCRNAFGWMLTGVPNRLTAEELAERDRVVAATYAARRTA